ASAVLLVIRQGKQRPVHYVSRTLHDAERNYAPLEKLVLALRHASRRLRRYFEAHPITVITDQPIKNVLSKADTSGRLAPYSVELAAYNITYEPRSAVKGQILEDFINETPITIRIFRLVFRAQSIPTEDPYKEAARQALEQEPPSPEYVSDPIELEDHAPVYVSELEHPKYHVPSDDDIQSMKEDPIDYPDEPKAGDEDHKEDPSEEHEPEDEDHEEDPNEEHELEDEDYEEDPSEEHEPEDEDTKEEEEPSKDLKRP
ncbi:reverse transcriptase domain-containing protein, partial [Tanacetum coccineum]